MTASSQNKIPWDQRQRFMLLEARVIWAGAIRRSELRDAFDISTGRADRDLAKYIELCPRNLRFDGQTGIHFPADGFEPAFLRGTAQEFLAVLRHHELAADLPLAMAASGSVPVETLEAGEREFDVRVLQRINVAIRERRWLAIEYQSMSRPDPRALLIAPHALAHSGRWHARAYSQEHDGYRDFLLSRIRGLPALREAIAHPALQGPDGDWDWRNYVSVRIAAHPGLTAPQKQVVEHDYGMRHGKLERALRVALVPYYLKLLNVGRGDIERPAAEQQIVLLNQAELDVFNRLG